MLSIIITSKTRIKLLIKFFLFDDIQGYLRSMEREFHESTNSIRIELKRFLDAGLLISERKGKRRYYTANKKHPFYCEIRHIVYKTVGIDKILKNINNKVPNLEAVFIVGNFASGVDSDTIELVFVGQGIDPVDINQRVKMVEKLIQRRIMHLLYTPDQMNYFFRNKPHLIIWKAGSKTASPVKHAFSSTT